MHAHNNTKRVFKTNSKRVTIQPGNLLQFYALHCLQMSEHPELVTVKELVVLIGTFYGLLGSYFFSREDIDQITAHYEPYGQALHNQTGPVPAPETQAETDTFFAWLNQFVQDKHTELEAKALEDQANGK